MELNVRNPLIKELVSFPFHENEKLAKETKVFLEGVIKEALFFWRRTHAVMDKLEFSKAAEKDRTDYSDDGHMYYLNMSLLKKMDEHSNNTLSQILRSIRLLNK